MLRELVIRNFAIIDDLHIRFSDGLTILSGETGAGKSIIINGVNLLLGMRANSDHIRTGADYAELEALFEITPDSEIAEALKTNSYYASEELLIRRIISRNGRHKIYINDRIATIAILNYITARMASISGQHAHQVLLNEDQHLMILDQFGKLKPLRDDVSRRFNEIQPLIRSLNDLKTLQKNQTERIEILEYQKNEIQEAAIKPDEDKALEQERLRLKNGELLYSIIYNSIEKLYDSRGSIVEQLEEMGKRLEKASQVDQTLVEKTKNIFSASYQIRDATEDLRAYLQAIRIDERRLEEIEIRIDALTKLKRKYGGSLEAVFSYLESIECELSQMQNISDSISEIERKLEILSLELAKSALRLSQERKTCADILAKKVESELAGLRMADTRFQVKLDYIPAGSNTDIHMTVDGSAITETGIDKATFLIAPNVGESLKPLSSIASGGELSRVVLALKVILTGADAVETVIFDEVDSGIGGSVAEIVGQKLFDLSRFHQVICITHLPQIAKFGNHHFRISKHVSNGRTRTVIDLLNNEERIKEIARMLGGIKITQMTINHALEMLRNEKGE